MTYPMLELRLVYARTDFYDMATLKMYSIAAICPEPGLTRDRVSSRPGADQC
jgi:hypothetical protein